MFWTMFLRGSIMNGPFIKRFVTVLSLGLLVAVYSASSASSECNDEMLSHIQKARPGIVKIEARMPITEKMGPFGQALSAHLDDTEKDHPSWYISLGSGIVWNNEGYVVTTKSVIKTSDNILIRTFHGDLFKANLVGNDDVTSIAVLKLELFEPNSLHPIPHRKRKLPEGATLVLMGYGIGGIPTISPGMAGIPPEDYDPSRHWFQFTAPLRPGNSGSALVDSSGKLAGIALGREEDIGFTAVIRMLTSQGQTDLSRSETISYSSLGIGIPISKAIPVVEQIIQAGRVVRGWIGVSVQKSAFDATGEHLLRVMRVIPGSPSEDAGLIPGDFIMCVNSRDVEDPRDLGYIVQEHPPGTKLIIDFLRDAEVFRTEIIVSERPTQRELLVEDDSDSSLERFSKPQRLDNNVLNN
jgi:S1-C subfamily serine protease